MKPSLYLRTCCTYNKVASHRRIQGAKRGLPRPQLCEMTGVT
jgi:hypothetical protein